MVLDMQSTAATTTSEENMDTRIVVGERGVEENGVVNGLYIAVHECTHGW